MNDEQKVILVTGATGNQGGAVAKALLHQNKFSLRAFVRDVNGDKEKALQSAGAELVQGNFDDIASLEKALENVYGVFSMQDFRNGSDTEIKQGKAIADAAKKAGVQHFVYSSVGSAERNTGIPHFESKFQIEEYIRTTGLPYTIMRPVFFMYNYNNMRQQLEQGALYMPLGADTVLQQLSEDDYGKMVADVFDDKEKFLNKAIEAASDALTMNETVAVFSRVLNKAVEYKQVSFEDFEKQAGKETTIMFKWFEHVGYNAALDQLTQTFFQLNTLEDYLRNHGWNKTGNTTSSLK